MVWERIKIYAYLLSLSTEKTINVFILVYILYIYNLYPKITHMSIGTSKFQRSVDITGFFLPFPHYRFVSPLTHRRKLISVKINIFIRFLSPVIHCIGFTL